MSRLVATAWPKILAGLMGVALLLSIGWTSRQWPAVRRLQLAPAVLQSAGDPYRLTDFAAPAVPAVFWPAPPDPAGPSDWLFEEFTPPLIYFDPQARSFAVTAPQLSVAMTGPFGLELEAIRLEPYRVQLAGYFGGPGRYVVALSNTARSGTTLLRVGERHAALGLRLVDFSVQKTTDRAGGPAVPVAHAVLHDDQTDTEVMLDGRSPKYTDRPLAVLRLPGPGRETHELHEGETIAQAGSIYRLEHIQLNPAEALVSRRAAGGSAPLGRVLQPVGRTGDSLLASQAAPARPQPADSLATNSN